MKSATSFGKPGLQDWLLQRMSAVVLGLYGFFLLGYLLQHHPLCYCAWRALFTQEWMRIFSLVALLSLLLHAWIGLWTITTDYLKAGWLRRFVQISILATFVSDFLWGIATLWGVR
ncbi:MAG: succinate dehydrogenase, hydrophobic membrane anchor protein [Gammaproteobacteria bacterium]|nr:succinate dehydrogenase, hydrophobic membrane anchor protein [Gammaproteobacteria bacterium]MBP9728766.1 succinate dehydrogenase, hydrophobic membrane anchor protein [Gammaproteobacteria bacterium]